jgi:DNA-binding NarL/FixJ family response regulator
MLVDDSRPFLTAATHLLAPEPGVRIVGTFTSAREALDRVSELQPDVILLDVFMPEMNGFDAARLFKAAPDAPRVVMVTLDDAPSLRTGATTHGADGFVPKNLLPTELVPLVRTLCG